MDRQAAFITMVNHMRTQGRQSFDEAGETCAYRGVGGLRCAVGALIPDTAYYSGIEGRGASAECVWRCVPGATANDAVFLKEAQIQLHDSGFTERRAQRFAELWDLEYSAP